MHPANHHARRSACLLAALLIVPGSAYGRQKPKGSEFKYAGGTETLRGGCEGALEVASAIMTFKCPSGSVSVPYASITEMQYRSAVSPRVRKLKLNWKVPLPSGGGRRNRYFSVVFAEAGATRVMILAASEQAMRPYLAEIDLKAGKRIEVQSHEDYD